MVLHWPVMTYNDDRKRQRQEGEDEELGLKQQKLRNMNKIIHELRGGWEEDRGSSVGPGKDYL